MKKKTKILFGIVAGIFIFIGILLSKNNFLAGKLKRLPGAITKNFRLSPIPKGLVPQALPAPKLLSEDCVSFNPATTKVFQQGNLFILKDGNHLIASFPQKDEAIDAFQIINAYGLQEQCFIGRGGSWKPLTYWVSKGRMAPSSKIAQKEDCIAFNRLQVSVQETNPSLFIIQEPGHSITSANSREQAEQIVKVWNAYEMDQICFVGRPDPSMVYFKASAPKAVAATPIPPATRQETRAAAPSSTPVPQPVPAQAPPPAPESAPAPPPAQPAPAPAPPPPPPTPALPPTPPPAPAQPPAIDRCIVSPTTNLQSCLTGLGNVGGTIIIGNGVQSTVENTLIIPANIRLEVSGSAREIFIGNGTVQFTDPTTTVYPAWWGHSSQKPYTLNDAAVKKAIGALPYGGTVQLGVGTFEHKLIEIADGVTLRGNACPVSCITDDPTNRTIIKVPDFPNDQEIKLFQPEKTFITCVNGAARCAVRDLEYNGNAPSNRNWQGKASGKFFPHWTRQDMDYNNAHGLYFFVPGQPGSQTSQLQVTIENVFVHDTMRDGLVTSPGVRLNVHNIRIKNSDLDHLIYLGSPEISILDTLTLEGYWSEEAVNGYAQEFHNVSFRNLAQNPITIANPSNPLDTFKSSFLFMRRSTTSPKHIPAWPFNGPMKIRNLTAEIGAQVPSIGIRSLESVDIENATFIQKEKRTTPFYLFQLFTNSTQTMGQRGFRSSNVQYTDADGPFGLLHTQGDLSADNVDISGVTVRYKGGVVAPVNNDPLLQIVGSAQNVNVSDVVIQNGTIPILIAQPGVSVSDFNISGIQICSQSPSFIARLDDVSSLRFSGVRIKDFAPSMITSRAQQTPPQLKTEEINRCL